MTRQNQVVRSSGASAGVAANRAFPGGIKIICWNENSYYHWTDSMVLAHLTVFAAEPYQRFYVSATINGVRCWFRAGDAGDTADNALGELWADDTYGFASASVYVPVIEGGVTPIGSLSMNGVIDLPAGTHLIELRAGPETNGHEVSCKGVTMTVIVGQVLEIPGCEYNPGCHPT